MTPLDRLRIEKAGADCGFEMTPSERDGGLELRSAHFSETVVVRPAGAATFHFVASHPALLDEVDGGGVLTVRGYNELYRALRTAAGHARTLPNRLAEAFRHEAAGLLRSTEAERLVVQRVGQNLFRAALLDYWQGRCCVTGLDMPELLRASHIKPWASCDSDDERLNVFNGLLLAPQLDALFDSGLMTVDDDGTVLMSSTVSPHNLRRLGVPASMTIGNLHDGQRRYLAFHRREIWRN